MEYAEFLLTPVYVTGTISSFCILLVFLWLGELTFFHLQIFSKQVSTVSVNLYFLHFLLHWVFLCFLTPPFWFKKVFQVDCSQYIFSWFYYIFLLIFLDFFYLPSPTRSLCASQAGFKFGILFLSTECWDYRYESPPSLATYFLVRCHKYNS